jgi:hypothetical protein
MIRGPGQVNTDFSVFKDFAFSERIRAQMRFEFFNLTNTPAFFLGAPSSSPMSCRGTSGGPCTNADFGKLDSGTATGRQIQIGWPKPCDSRVVYLGIQDKDKVVVVSVPDRKIIRVIDTPAGAGPDTVAPL